MSTEQVSHRMYVSSRKTTVMSSEEHKVTYGDGNVGDQKGHSCSSADDKETCGISHLFKLLVCVLCGMIFGTALNKAHVMEPSVIRLQMVMQQFTMLKFFLSGLATSMFTLSMLAMLPVTNRAFTIVCKDFFTGFLSHSVASSLLGGAFMGLGMTLAGSCPSAIFVQLGAMVPNAQYTLLGALLAVFVYSLIRSPVLDAFLKPSVAQSSNPWANSSYFVTALPLVAMFGITACAFETLIPSENEIKFTGHAGDSWLSYNVWPPYICAMLVGSLQIPMVLVMGDTLGGSSSLSFIVAQLFVRPLENRSPYAKQFRRWTISNYWQVFYVLGAVLGGYLSASASGTVGQMHGVSALASFCGGFCLYFGARIGGGCTSGNGLSGMGLLSILSFIMIAATFASGMTSAFLMQWYGLL